MNAPDLSTVYLGIPLRNPLVASAGPLTGDLSTLLRLEEAGAAAAVLPSLFQEEVEHEELEIGRLHDTGAESFPEASSYFPLARSYHTGPEGYLRRVEEARSALSIPVIASLNGVSCAGWARYAKKIENAGAQAIELNVFYVPTDPLQSGADVEALFVDQVAAVRAAVEIPIAVKIGPFLSAPANAATKLAEAGASGLVLFNRFLEPDIDLETLEVVPHLELSRRAEMRLSMRWIAILAGRTPLSLAASSGVHEPADAIKLLLAGADVTMTTSALLRRGPEYMRTLLAGLGSWLAENEYESVAQMRGSMSFENCPDPRAYERLNYMRALASYSTSL